MSAYPIVTFFKDIDKHDTPLVGGKGANLGEMTKAGFPVPNGFAITINAYDAFLAENEIAKKIYEILGATDVNDPTQLDSASKRIQKMIINGSIPDDVTKEVLSGYKKLSGVFKKALVAVRSSATAEDLATTSFAGQGVSLLNVTGDANLLVALKECWASLFTGRSIYYRVENKIKHESVKIAVIVMKMVQSEVSGVMFSIDPAKNDKDRIIIESVWGLGEMIVQGSVIPDKYVVQKGTFAILSKEISDQSIQLIRAKNGKDNVETEVPKRIRQNQKISDEEVVKLAKIAANYKNITIFPRMQSGLKKKVNYYLVQTRPITTIAQTTKTEKLEKRRSPDCRNPHFSPVPLPPLELARDQFKILKSPKEIGKIETR